MNELTQVAEDAGEVVDTTLSNDGVAAATPAKSPVDAERLLVENQQLAEQIAQAKRDVNGVKSSLQKQIAQQQKDFAAKEQEFNRRISEAAMQGMNEDDRIKYEKQLVAEKLQTLGQKEAEIEKIQNQYAITTEALDYFLGQGVPREVLVLTEGYDALYQSGMGWIMNEFARLKANPASAQPASKKTLKEAPTVVTESSSMPNVTQSWETLKKATGLTEEEIWRRVEQGTLSPEIIPGVKDANKKA